MRAAWTVAAGLLGAARTRLPATWGHTGRTLGGPVVRDGARCWLRVAEAPAARPAGKLWEGTAVADRVLPTAVPRPQLLAVADVKDTSGTRMYRGELTTYVDAPACSPTPDLRTAPGLGDPWWADLRAAVDRIAAAPIPYGRDPVISQAWLDRSLPRFLGDLVAGVDTTCPRWEMAHGDLHWANLTAPELVLLDWEGCGAAPAGWDAATLHAYALPCPAVATHVRDVFADVLDTDAGRFAQLAVAAQIVQAGERDPVHARLVDPVRAHVGRTSQQ